jgi:predicted nucleic acid-binding protein
MKQSDRSPRTRVNDIWIAAQAMEDDYALLTTNLKDFEGLLVYEYLVREDPDRRLPRSPKGRDRGHPQRGLEISP